MSSTYSTSLKLELIGNGDQSGVWGNTTNNNLGALLEQYHYIPLKFAM